MDPADARREIKPPVRVSLPPMSAAAWETWLGEAFRAYAGDKVRIGAWPADGAEAKARDEFARLVPGGRSTPGHEFRSIGNDAGETVGTLWVGPDEAIGQRSLFIWDIGIAAEFRGRGYGRAALEAIEPVARDLGYDSIRLHVFGDNAVARRLYRSAGYVETDVSMLKRLG